MDDLFIEDEIRDLREKIAYYNTLYYKKAISEITDLKYDQLVKRLQNLEKKYPQYKIDKSPTEIVGSDITGKGKIIPHKVRMYSLDNAYSLKEIEEFIERVKKVDERKLTMATELKIDGFSINLYYENSKLQYATTRGDGFEGEDVTENIKTLKSIPIEIKYKEPI